MQNNKELIKTFGSNVRTIRKSRGLSQEELAEIAGLHRTYIGMIERAEKNISLTNISKIAYALETDICNLIRENGK